MIATWLTRLYVVGAALMMSGLLGLLLEAFSPRALPWLALLLCSYYGLYTLWRMAGVHKRVLSEKSLDKTMLRRFTAGAAIGAVGLVVPVIANDKMLAFAIPLGIPAIAFLAYFSLRWKLALR